MKRTHKSPKKPIKNTPTNRTTHVRIIGGQWRRRLLPVGIAPGLRPTGDRIRETLFNWLMNDIADARCLDVFAGTGALGTEALSRGADYVLFAETHAGAAKQLIHNLTTLEADKAGYAVYHGNGLDHLANYQGAPFDVVFIDPPFDNNLWQESFAVLTSNKLLAHDALIYVESPIETKLMPPENWLERRSLTAGAVRAQLFQCTH